MAKWSPVAILLGLCNLIIRSTNDQIAEAKQNGEVVTGRYFLFPRGSKFKEPEIRRALQLGVPVVPSVNVFHYLGINHQARAKQDIDRMRRAGVREFQIDSVYDQWLAN